MSGVEITDLSGPARAFYERQIAALEARDIGKIAQQYRPDAQLLGFEVQVEGREAIRAHFERYLAGLGFIRLLSTDRWAQTSDSLFFEATVQTAAGQARVYDVFVLQGDQASRHFTGLISFMPGAQTETTSSKPEGRPS